MSEQKKLFVRVIQPNSAKIDGEPFIHDEWMMFIPQRVLHHTGQPSEMELRDKDNRIFTAPSRLVVSYPPHIAVTRDFGEGETFCQIYDAFKVDFEQRTRPGFVPVRNISNRQMELPSSIITQIELHPCDPKTATAV